MSLFLFGSEELVFLFPSIILPFDIQRGTPSSPFKHKPQPQLGCRLLSSVPFSPPSGSPRIFFAFSGHSPVPRLLCPFLYLSSLFSDPVPHVFSPCFLVDPSYFPPCDLATGTRAVSRPIRSTPIFRSLWSPHTRFPFFNFIFTSSQYRAPIGKSPFSPPCILSLHRTAVHIHTLEKPSMSQHV